MGHTVGHTAHLEHSFNYTRTTILSSRFSILWAAKFCICQDSADGCSERLLRIWTQRYPRWRVRLTPDALGCPLTVTRRTNRFLRARQSSIGTKLIRSEVIQDDWLIVQKHATVMRLARIVCWWKWFSFSSQALSKVKGQTATNRQTLQWLVLKTCLY